VNRSWNIWPVFGVCLLVLLATLGWMTRTTLRLDRVQREMARQAELEERVRLALWRMDSALTALFVEESARPVNAYRAFYEAERAYTKEDNFPLRKGDVLVPSPLLTLTSSYVRLHFQRDSAGGLTSPQVPTGPQRTLALGGYVTPARLETFEARLAAMAALLEQPAQLDPGAAPGVPASKLAAQPWRNDDVLMHQSGAAANPVSGPAIREQAVWAGTPESKAETALQQAKESQTFRNTAELQVRANVYQQAQQQAVLNVNPDQRLQPSATPNATERLAQGIVFKAMWLGDQLVLARQVWIEGRFVAQACWLDWPQLRESLVESIGDLCPNAALEPVPGVTGNGAARRLAALPVNLASGLVPGPTARAWSPVQTSLVVAWACGLLAGVAAAWLLQGTLSLSERRAAFVSAVTHELRTPLTTFKLYSEMLAEDMVPDAAKRRSYLATLCAEADRLSHLVENVLAYARLERGRTRQRVERLTLGELLERVVPRLEQRASEAGLSLVVEADAATRPISVQVDVSVVEQILFNLVDNACKYAAPGATDKAIQLEALPADRPGRWAWLRVRDRGPGIPPAVARRLFQPFSKPASEAARTAPGVGLGLALCRRLSRSLGGDLRWDASVRDGACFVLALPVAWG